MKPFLIFENLESAISTDTLAEVTSLVLIAFSRIGEEACSLWPLHHHFQPLHFSSHLLDGQHIASRLVGRPSPFSSPKLQLIHAFLYIWQGSK